MRQDRGRVGAQERQGPRDRHSRGHQLERARPHLRRTTCETVWSVEGLELPPALALLLRVDLVGAHERPFQRRFDLWPAGDLASDVADDAAELGAQQAQLPMVAFELLGVGIAPPSSRRFWRCADRTAATAPRAFWPAGRSRDRRMQQLGVSCSEAAKLDRFWLEFSAPSSRAGRSGER